MTTKQDLIRCIQSTNRFLTTNHLEQLEYVALLRNVYPLYRADYARKFFNEGLITEIERKCL